MEHKNPDLLAMHLAMTNHSPIDSNISYNFEIAKVIAILGVVTGHFFSDTILWVPVTIGLFLFSFSSAFFTSAKYKGSFSKKEFWHKKYIRLGINVFVINVFLLILFIIEKRPGIWTWQTVLNMMGLTGILNWFQLNNPSPFGAGLWFFTLLLIFYSTYPLIDLLHRSRLTSYSSLVLFLAVALYLHQHVQVGHMLWLTAFGFFLGVFIERNRIIPSPSFSVALAIAATAIMVLMNYGFIGKQYNYYFLLFISVATVLWLTKVKLPQKFGYPFHSLSRFVLEIYFIHTYLFIRPTGFTVFDFAISMICIITIALMLYHISQAIHKWMIIIRKGSLSSVQTGTSR